MTDLTVLIPSRNEQFLKQTIDDILLHSEADTEIIAVLDGSWPLEPIPDNPRLTLIYHPVAIGQRAACNEAASMAASKYVMKVDAHCGFDQGFDRKLLQDMQPDWALAPIMRNLHAFDWVCENGHRRYQGPSGVCKECGQPTKMDMVWISKGNPQSASYCFDSEPHFQYFREFNKRPEGKGELTESMSLQGSCFMVTKEKWFDLNICDEVWGSWGSQGLEVACKIWLSGGKVMISHKTFYSHLFRTQGADFGFPYELSGKQVEHAKQMARDMFFENKWNKQIHPLSWLVEKFWPVPGWSDADLAKVKQAEGKVNAPPVGKIWDNTAPITDFSSRSFAIPPTAGILYYTDGNADPRILQACQRQLKASAGEHKIVNVSLKPMDFGWNVVVPLERGYLTLFKQMLIGLLVSDADIIYFCEHDCLYADGYFDFVPPDPGKIYYNTNVWKIRYNDGHALYYTAKHTSQLCAYRELLIEHYSKRVANTERAFAEYGGDTKEYRKWIRQQGFEPGANKRAERVDDLESDTWTAGLPNLDIRHDHNLTPSRWNIEQFRDKRNCQNWQEADSVPAWGQTAGCFEQLLDNIK